MIILKWFFLDGEKNGVGKTSIIKRILNNEFEESLSPIFQEECSKTIILKTGYKVTLNFIDTKDFNKNIDFILLEIEESDFILFIDDATRKDSFDGIKKIYNDIKDTFGKDKKIYLIGNKIDLYDKNKKDILFGKNDVMKFAKQNNLRFFEISCKENIDIKELFADICYETIKISEKSEKSEGEKSYSLYLSSKEEPNISIAVCSIF